MGLGPGLSLLEPHIAVISPGRERLRLPTSLSIQLLQLPKLLQLFLLSLTKYHLLFLLLQAHQTLCWHIDIRYIKLVLQIEYLLF